MYNLSIENQENYNNLLKWLMNYALAHHIGVSFTHELPPYAPPTSFSKPGKLILMNGNWKPMTEIPYSLAHEIGHVMLECPEYYHLALNGKIKGEYTANRFAIDLLKEYCLENDYYYSTTYSFALSFCIPHRYHYLLENQKEPIYC